MIELNFVAGGEVMWIRVVGKIISIRGKMSNYTWMDLRDLTGKEQTSLSKKHGATWFNDYLKALKLKKRMTEEEISSDLTKDMQSAGWRLVRKTT